MEEKLCLQWNDFKENLGSSFGDLRGDKDLTDVTLACEDGKQVEAHKVILAASSPFFMDLLKQNKKHPHPLIYMRGLKSADLLAVVDFLYFGETNLLQENLDSFLALAEELQLKGLTGASDNSKAEGLKKEADLRNRELPVQKEIYHEQRKPKNLGYQTSANPNTAVAVVTENQVNTNIQDLNKQIKTMMTITEIRSADGQGFVATCNVCGKQASSRNMGGHIEANHITGVSHSCNLCGKVSRSRDALRKHKNLYH